MAIFGKISSLVLILAIEHFQPSIASADMVKTLSEEKSLGEKGYIIGCSFAATFKVSSCLELPSGKTVEYEKELNRRLSYFDDPVKALSGQNNGILMRVVTQYDPKEHQTTIVAFDSIAKGTNFEATLVRWLASGEPEPKEKLPSENDTMAKFMEVSEHVQFMYAKVNAAGEIQREIANSEFLEAAAKEAAEAKRIQRVRASMLPEQAAVNARSNAAIAAHYKRVKEWQDFLNQREMVLGTVRRVSPPTTAPSEPVDIKKATDGLFIQPIKVAPTPYLAVPESLRASPPVLIPVQPHENAKSNVPVYRD